jgi:hypothetical protein
MTALATNAAAPPGDCRGKPDARDQSIHMDWNVELPGDPII